MAGGRSARSCGRSIGSSARGPSPGWPRAAPGAVRRRARRGRLRGAGRAARADGPGRLPARPGRPARRRGRLPGHLPGPGPQGAVRSGIATSLGAWLYGVARRVAPAGRADARRRRRRERPGVAGGGHGDHRGTAIGDEPARRARRGARPAAGEVPGAGRALLPRGPDARRGRRCGCAARSARSAAGWPGPASGCAAGWPAAAWRSRPWPWPPRRLRPWCHRNYWKRRSGPRPPSRLVTPSPGRSRRARRLSTRRVLRTMLMTRLGTMATVTLLAGITAGGAGVVVRELRVFGGRPPPQHRARRPRLGRRRAAPKEADERGRSPGGTDRRGAVPQGAGAVSQGGIEEGEGGPGYAQYRCHRRGIRRWGTRRRGIRRWGTRRRGIWRWGLGGMPKQAIPTLESGAIIVVQSPGRDKVWAQSIESGSWKLYRVPKGVKATPLP